MMENQRMACYKSLVYRTTGSTNVDFNTAAYQQYRAQLPRQGLHAGLPNPPPGTGIAPALRPLPAQGMNAPVAHTITARMRSLRQRLEHHQLKFRKRLGWGGNGLTALFSLRGTGPNPELFVAKTALRDTPETTASLQREQVHTAVSVLLWPRCAPACFTYG